MNILIADDDITLHNLLSIIIQRIGYESNSAFDGEETFAKTCASHYDIIFLDYNMPYINGFEVARMIRKHESENHITPAYIVFISSFYDQFTEQYDYLIRENDSTINKFIHKPLNYRDIELVIKSLETRLQLKS